MLQIVFVKWGTAYNAAHVNVLCSRIKQETNVPLHFLCITDDGIDLSEDIDVRPFPDMGMPFEWLTKRSCFGKLSMFVEGTLDHGVKTLYFDLDTAVFGDVARLAECLDANRGLYMLPNHYVQHWKVRWLTKLIAPKRYYFGNSSIMAFYPEDYHEIAASFMRDFPRVKERAEIDGEPVHSAFRTDDRYVSYFCRETIRVFPGRLAARFQDTYMTFAFWMSELQDRLPWVQSRRNNRVALTFMGAQTKPDRLAAVQNGDEIQFGRLKTRWNYPRLKRYWVEIAAGQTTVPQHDQSSAVAERSVI